MKRLLSLLVVLVVVVVIAQMTEAQSQSGDKESDRTDKPGGISIEAISATAEVVGINAANRMVTLKFGNGRTGTFKLDEGVKNFDQIRLGDEVKATYLESIAIYVRKSAGGPPSEEIRTIQVAPKGAKPGVVVTHTAEISAKVESLDLANRLVTLKGPEGERWMFSVDKDATEFDKLKEGDEIVLRITEAMMIAVEKPAAAK